MAQALRFVLSTLSPLTDLQFGLHRASGGSVLALALKLTWMHCNTDAQAAQALEPAALIPLPMLSPAGRMVLVGDPAQLPATVLSSAAAAANLAQSLFERLQRVRRATSQ